MSAGQVLRRSKTTERPEGVWAAAVYGGGDTTLKVKRDFHGDFHGNFFGIFFRGKSWTVVKSDIMGDHGLDLTDT